MLQESTSPKKPLPTKHARRTSIGVTICTYFQREFGIFQWFTRFYIMGHGCYKTLSRSWPTVIGPS